MSIIDPTGYNFETVVSSFVKAGLSATTAIDLATSWGLSPASHTHTSFAGLVLNGVTSFVTSAKTADAYVYDAFNDGAEIGISVPILQCRNGRLDFNPTADNKSGIRLTGNNTEFNVYNTTKNQFYFKVDSNLRADFYGDVIINDGKVLYSGGLGSGYMFFYGDNVGGLPAPYASEGQLRYVKDGYSPLALSQGYQWTYFATIDQLNNIQTYFTGYANDRSVDASYRTVNDNQVPDQGYYPTTPLDLIFNLATQVKKITGLDHWYDAPQSSLSKTSEVNSNTTIVPDSSYRVNNGTQVTLTLPTTAPVDSSIRVIGQGSGGWKIAQNAGQKIVFGNKTSLTGTGGSINSTYARDCVHLICTVDNTEWQVVSSQGNINIVEV